MNLEPLSSDMEVELVVNAVGSAMLLHKGPMLHQYAWAQYDTENAIMQFVTEAGEMQNLGLPLEESMKEPLKHTKEILMLELTDDGIPCMPRFLKFTQLTSY